MKRVIKFRAFDKKAKTMYNIRAIDFENQEMLIEDEVYDVLLSFNDVALMQFTGLYDKNGKEIYEGDVIPIFGKNHAVKFQNGMFTIKDRSITRYTSSILLEVIGNVYENPELLK